MRNQGDPSQWKAIVGRASLPPHLQGLASRPLHSAEQHAALRQTLLMIFSPVILGIAWLVAGFAIRDLAVDAPPLGPIALIVAVIGFGLWWGAVRDFMPRLCGALARLGWVVVATGAFAYSSVSIYAHREAAAGPLLRAQVARIESHGRGLATAILILQDGSSVAVQTSAGGLGTRRCYAVRRVTGPYGFAWVRMVDASPPPGPGQLEWPIDLADCFSATPLSSMGR